MSGHTVRWETQHTPDYPVSRIGHSKYRAGVLNVQSSIVDGFSTLSLQYGDGLM